MADAIVMNPQYGAATFTVDPSNSSISPTNRMRGYVEGPPTDGQPNGVSRWILQAPGTATVTSSLSMSNASYRFLENVPYYTISPTTYAYVGMGS